MTKYKYAVFCDILILATLFLATYVVGACIYQVRMDSMSGVEPTYFGRYIIRHEYLVESVPYFLLFIKAFLFYRKNAKTENHNTNYLIYTFPLLLSLNFYYLFVFSFLFVNYLY